jgi:hypothetical protein
MRKLKLHWAPYNALRNAAQPSDSHLTIIVLMHRSLEQNFLLVTRRLLLTVSAAAQRPAADQFATTLHSQNSTLPSTC